MVEDFGKELPGAEFDEFLRSDAVAVACLNMVAQCIESNFQNGVSSSLIEVSSTLKSYSCLLEPRVEVATGKVIDCKLLQVLQSLLLKSNCPIFRHPSHQVVLLEAEDPRVESVISHLLFVS